MIMLISQAVSVIVLIGISVYFYKFYFKKDYLKQIKLLSEQLDQRLSQLTEQISAQMGVAKNSGVLGLVELQPDAANIYFDSIITDSRKLLLLLNDGRTWASVHRDRLRKRFSDPTKETTFFIIHPESPMMEVLARKGSIDSNILKQRINETLHLLNEISTEDTNLEILGHFLFNPHSVVMSEDCAIVIPYFVSRGGRTVTGFRYDNINSDDCFYYRLYEDLERLRMDSQRLLLSEKGVLLSGSGIYYDASERDLAHNKVVNIKNSKK